MSLLDALINADLTNPIPYKSEWGANVSRREVFIAIRVDGAIGSGNPDDPYNGSTDELLDALLRDGSKITGNMTIRFGPGVFETKGNGFNPADSTKAWSPKAGQRFIGSGMAQTTLRLVKAAPGNHQSGIAQLAVFA